MYWVWLGERGLDRKLTRGMCAFVVVELFLLRDIGSCCRFAIILDSSAAYIIDSSRRGIHDTRFFETVTRTCYRRDIVRVLFALG